MLVRQPQGTKKACVSDSTQAFRLIQFKDYQTSTTHITTEIKAAFVRDPIQSNRVSVGE